jgi:hypothetical protein
MAVAFGGGFCLCIGFLDKNVPGAISRPTDRPV